MKALVTGASKGIGRGIAISLATKRYDLVLTGRDKGKLEEIGLLAKDHAVECTIIVCDHSDLVSTEEAFARVQSETFDLVVNNAWGGYEKMQEDGNYTWEKKFWDQPQHRWTSMMDVGVRTAFICSKYCARKMVEAGRGLIVNISFWAAQKYMQNVIYGTSKAAIDKMTSDMAVELLPHGVSVVSLYPGLVRTEAVMAAAEYFDLSNSESPQFVGLVIEGVARDRDVLAKSGKVYTTAGLAIEYGISDIDGKVIREERQVG